MLGGRRRSWWRGWRRFLRRSEGWLLWVRESGGMELMGGRSREGLQSVGYMLRTLGIWWLMSLLCGMSK